MKDKVLRRQWLPTRPSGITHVCSITITQCYEEQRIIIIIIIMAVMAVFNVAGYLIEERLRWPVITASPRGQCSK